MSGTSRGYSAREWRSASASMRIWFAEVSRPEVARAHGQRTADCTTLKSHWLGRRSTNTFSAFIRS